MEKHIYLKSRQTCRIKINNRTWGCTFCELPGRAKTYTINMASSTYITIKRSQKINRFTSNSSKQYQPNYYGSMALIHTVVGTLHSLFQIPINFKGGGGTWKCGYITTSSSFHNYPLSSPRQTLLVGDLNILRCLFEHQMFILYCLNTSYIIIIKIILINN